MLDDRDYMRQPEYNNPRWRSFFHFRGSWTVALIVAFASVFIIELVAQRFFPGNIFFQSQEVLAQDGLKISPGYLPLSVEGLKQGYIWQFVTYQFLHVSWLHLIFNCLAIYFFGRSVETVVGGSRFLALYFSSGIIGGVVQMLLAFWRPDVFGDAVVGASAGAYGLVAAFAVLNWEERFTLLIYFIPVSMRGKTLLWVSLALVVIGLLTPHSGIANAAHLGGILTGFLYVRQIVQGRWHLPQWKLPARRSSPPREFVAAGKGKRPFWRPAADVPDEDLTADEFLQREVDPILDKISAHGIHSLTARERDILEKARTKMQKR